jgi:hypothetical protein
MNNLFISYDLNQPGQNYERVIEAIKTLGNWAKVQKSFWYVRSSLSASQALERLKPSIDRSDSLFVVDSTNDSAAWQGVSHEVGEHMRKHWSSGAYAVR